MLHVSMGVFDLSLSNISQIISLSLLIITQTGTPVKPEIHPGLSRLCFNRQTDLVELCADLQVQTRALVKHEVVRAPPRSGEQHR